MRRSISRAGTVTLSDQRRSVVEAFLRILSSGFQPLPTRHENRPTQGEEGKRALPQLPARERECARTSVYGGTGGRLSPTQDALECIQHFLHVFNIPPCAPLDTRDTRTRRADEAAVRQLNHTSAAGGNGHDTKSHSGREHVFWLLTQAQTFPGWPHWTGPGNSMGVTHTQARERSDAVL